MRAPANDLHPRAVLESQLGTATHEAKQKSERLAHVREEAENAEPAERAAVEARVERAEYEAGVTVRTRDELAKQLDKLRKGEK